MIRLCPCQSQVSVPTQETAKRSPFLSFKKSVLKKEASAAVSEVARSFVPVFSAFSRYTPFCKQFFRVVHHSFEIYEANLKEICEIVCNCFSEDVRLLGKYLCRKCTAPNCADKKGTYV